MYNDFHNRCSPHPRPSCPNQAQADSPQTSRLLAAIAGPSMRTLICINGEGVQWAVGAAILGNGPDVCTLSLDDLGAFNGKVREGTQAFLNIRTAASLRDGFLGFAVNLALINASKGLNAAALRKGLLFVIFGQALVFLDREALEAFIASDRGRKELLDWKRWFVALDGFFVNEKRERGWLWQQHPAGAGGAGAGAGGGVQLQTPPPARRGHPDHSSEAFVEMAGIRAQLEQAEDALGQGGQDKEEVCAPCT